METCEELKKSILSALALVDTAMGEAAMVKIGVRDILVDMEDLADELRGALE